MKSSSSPATIAIIGGGPAGLMAAEKLSATGASVTVYDRMPTVGRKLLMAGRGGLNLTHSEPLDRFVERYGEAAAWLAPTIHTFPPAALRAWCESFGLETFVGSSGRIFPKELKASPLLRAWLRRLNAAAVKFAPRHTWRGWNADGSLAFINAEGSEIKIQPDATLLALGGASWPRLGSNGAWVDLLSAQGINVAPLRPANCGFFAPWSEIFSTRFAGEPLKPVTISFGGKKFQGEAMVTREGLEGGVIYTLSRLLRESIDATGEAILTLDLRPGLSEDALAGRLQMPRGHQSATAYLRKSAGLSPVALGLMRESCGSATLPTETDALVSLIKKATIKLTAIAPIARAISSAGGITHDEIDAHFMLKKKPGIFVAGEMLDWEAPTGGYLLQANFSTGVAAALGIEKYLGLS